MITPELIASKRFDKAMGGFRQDEVEEFLNQVAEEYGALVKEKEELEEKINLLAEKIEQYRADEDSLRSALIGAQKLGDSVIRDSKIKAENILREATVTSEKMMEEAQKNIKKEEITLIKMQKEVSKFKNRLLTIYKQHLELISALPEYSAEEVAVDEAAAAATTVPETVPPAAQQPPALQEEAPVTGETVELDFSGFGEKEPRQEPLNFAEIEEEPETSNSKFGPLKFGEGFDVERDEGQKNALFSRKKHK